jgi:hypothetical protein
MCTTTQYFFCCGHPATHRFRTELCPQSKGRTCRIRDTNRFIEGECRKCQLYRQTRRRIPRGRNQDAFDDIWYIPTRCFVDVGFQSLNPFLVDIEPDPISPLTTVPPTFPLPSPAPKTESLSGMLRSPGSEKSPVERLFPRFRRHKKSSSCCEDMTLENAFQAVRLEDYDARIEGRIMDNHCQSNA